MVFLVHRPRVALTTLTTVVEATALFVQQQCHVKGAIIVDHVDPASWQKMIALHGITMIDLLQYSAANSRQSGLHFRRARY